MRESWQLVTIGEVATIALSGVDKHIVPGEIAVSLCNYLDVYRNRRLTKEMDFARGSATPGEIARFKLRKGDVVITKDSETPDDIGIPAIVIDDLPNTICGYHLAIVRPGRRLDSRFLSHYLQSDAAKKHFLRTANGVTRFGLGMRAVSSLSVLLPSLDEQAAIARILDAVDAALEHTSAAVDRAKHLKRALLQRFFYDALGETAYADRPRNELPVGWSLIATEHLLAEEPKNGVSPAASSQPPGTPTFSIAAIRDGLIDLESVENLKYVQLPNEAVQRYAIGQGDVLIVRGNANPDLVGKAAIVGSFPAGCIYPDIAKRVVFRADSEPKVIPEFAVLAWNHAIVHNQVLRRAKTSNGTLKINNRDVKQIVMPVPAQDVQSDIVRLAGAVDARVAALTAVNNAQHQVKRALMQDLLAGPVRLKCESRAAAS